VLPENKCERNDGLGSILTNDNTDLLSITRLTAAVG
jgi:hypothetical protein